MKAKIKVVKEIEMLFECDAIYMLNGWENSRGAKIEKHIAETTGKHVWFEPEFVRYMQK